MHDEIIAWRRELHANPELRYELPWTASFVADRLRAFGCDSVTEGVGVSGVVAVIKGRSQASGKVIGLRADMDALPIKETTGLSYSSRNVGRMHACGHDGHTAMLLGAAKGPGRDPQLRRYGRADFSAGGRRRRRRKGHVR